MKIEIAIDRTDVPRLIQGMTPNQYQLKELSWKSGFCSSRTCMCVNHDPVAKADSLVLECEKHSDVEGVYVIIPSGVPFRPTMWGRPGSARQACYKVYIGEEALTTSDSNFYTFPSPEEERRAEEEKNKRGEFYKQERQRLSAATVTLNVIQRSDGRMLDRLDGIDSDKKPITRWRVNRGGVGPWQDNFDLAT